MYTHELWKHKSQKQNFLFEAYIGKTSVQRRGLLSKKQTVKGNFTVTTKFLSTTKRYCTLNFYYTSLSILFRLNFAIPLSKTNLMTRKWIPKGDTDYNETKRQKCI